MNEFVMMDCRCFHGCTSAQGSGNDGNMYTYSVTGNRAYGVFLETLFDQLEHSDIPDELIPVVEDIFL